MMLFLCTVGVALMTQVMVAETCPTNAVNEVFLCLSNLTAGIHDGGKKLGADSYIIKRICRTKEFQTAINCVEGLFRDCRHKKKVDLLKMLADPHKIQQAFDELCTNLDLYVDSSPCMMEQDHIIQPCFRQKERDFDENIAKSASVKQEIETFCRFQTGMRACIIQPVRDACGTDIGELLLTFMTGVTSPVCNDMAASDSIILKPINAVLLLMTLLTTRVFM